MTTSRWVLGIWLLVMLGSAWLLARTAITTDLTALLPPSAGRAQHLLMTQLREGPVSRLILIGLAGSDPEMLAEASRRIARRLAQSGLFEYVNNGEAVYAAAEREFLMRHRYLLSPAVSADRFTPRALREALQQNLRALASPMGAMVKATLPADPTGELRAILSQLSAEGGPSSRYGVWFSNDGLRAQLVAETAAPGFELEAQQRAVDLIRSAAKEAGVSTGGLLLSGPAVFAVASRATIERESWNLSLIAAGAVTTILLTVYRSVRVVFVSLLPVASGLIVGVAVVGLIFGSVHGITLGFGATLIGEAVDYPTYLLTHVASGEAVPDTLKRLWPTLRLAVLTTVFGGLTMLLSSFAGLAQLGTLSMTGTLVAGLVTRWVVPALTPPRVQVRTLPWDWTSLLRFPGTTGLRGVWIGLVVALLWLAAHQDRLWDDDLANLSPISDSAKAQDQQLRAELGAPDVRYLIVAAGESQEDALTRSETLATRLRDLVEKGALAGFDMPGHYLPSREIQAKRRAALPEPAVLQGALKEALAGLPFREGLFVPFLEAVEEARRGTGLELTDLHGSALGLKLQALLLPMDHEWIALMPLRGVQDAALVAAHMEEALESRGFFLDLKEESNRLVNGYRQESLRLTGLGLLAIALVLAWGLRSATKAARVLIPVLIAVVWAVAVLTILGERLSLFHLVSLLLVIGIGLNYALFFNREPVDDLDRQRTVLSLTVCSLATLSAFSTLAFSHTPVLHAIGLTVALGCFTALVIAGLLARPR